MRILISYFFGKNAIPLGASSARALEALGHEVRCYDSGIESPVDAYFFKYANKLIRVAGKGLDISKGSRWNNQMYREAGLEKAVKLFRPDVLFVIRGHGFGPEVLQNLRQKYGIKKIAGWWVKGPVWKDLMHRDARYYDRYFSIHREFEDGEILYLPAIAVDDTLYRRLGAGGDEHDVTFVGGWTPRRQEVIKEIQGFPLSIWGPRWWRKNFFNTAIRGRIRGNGIYGDALVRVYNSSKIVLNISNWDTRQSGLNLRIFDVPACAAFLLTDHSDEISEYFKAGVEIETYKDTNELKDKLGYYLENPEARQKIAARGHEKVKSLPTYKDRMAEMLKYL